VYILLIARILGVATDCIATLDHDRTVDDVTLGDAVGVTT
jgi:hypothetical protein